MSQSLLRARKQNSSDRWSIKYFVSLGFYTLCFPRLDITKQKKTISTCSPVRCYLPASLSLPGRYQNKEEIVRLSHFCRLLLWSSHHRVAVEQQFSCDGPGRADVLFHPRTKASLITLTQKWCDDDLAKSIFWELNRQQWVLMISQDSQCSFVSRSVMTRVKRKRDLPTERRKFGRKFQSRRFIYCPDSRWSPEYWTWQLQGLLNIGKQGVKNIPI